MADQAINALSTKTAPETSDQLLLVGTGEPQLIDYDKLADAILNKITSKNYALDAGQMTLLAALNKLNSDKIKATTFKVSVNVAANKAYSTDISYQSISGEVLFSDVTWSNEKSDTPIYVTQYRTGACTISSISHKWAIDQKVSFIVAVLYI